MELRQLKYFEKSAELLNFTEAARTLFISQSTLSQQIKQLEDELGVQLFNRIGKRIMLTDAGSVFLPFAKKTIQEAKDGELVIRDLQNMATGTLSIGVTYSLSNILNSSLIEFSKRYPAIHVEIVFGTTEELSRRLEENSLDFILSLKTRSNSLDNEAITLFQSALHLIAPHDHPVASKSQVTLGQIEPLPLVLPAKGFFSRRVIDQEFEARGLKPNICIELNDVNTVLHLANKGSWLTILTLASIVDQPDLVGIPISDLTQKFEPSLIWARGSYRKKSAECFASIIQQLVTK